MAGIKIKANSLAADGADVFRSIDCDESAEEVKAGPGILYGGIVINTSDTIRHMKLYNRTLARVTVGTTTPFMTIPIPTTGTADEGSGFTLNIPLCGIGFDEAITVAVTTDLDEDDSPGAPDANDVIVQLWYK